MTTASVHPLFVPIPALCPDFCGFHRWAFLGPGFRQYMLSTVGGPVAREVVCVMGVGDIYSSLCVLSWVLGVYFSLWALSWVLGYS